MNSTPIVAAVLVPFVLWRVYNRIKRLMVRQRSQAWRHWIAAILFPALLLTMALFGLSNPVALAGLAAGVTVGVGLAVVALNKTRFEYVDGQFFFTPNAHIGIIVSMVFLSRLLYRAYEYYVNGAAPQGATLSPLTMLAFGVMAGYYAVYATGLLRWRRAQKTNP